MKNCLLFSCVLLLSVPAIVAADDDKEDIMRGGTLRETREAMPKKANRDEVKPETPATEAKKAAPATKAEAPKQESARKSERTPGKQYTAWPERLIQTKIGREPRTAYLMANTVFKVGDKLKPGFYWSSFGGDPFFKVKDVTFDEAAENRQFWSVNILPKMWSAVEVAEELNILMPPEDKIRTCLDNPTDPELWKDGFVRHKDEYAFGVGGSPNVESVKHPGNGPTDDYAVYVNIVAVNPGNRANKQSCDLRWEDDEWRYERELVQAKPCFNGPLFTHLRKFKKVRVADGPPEVRMERELKTPPEKPETDDDVPTAAVPPEEFDRRDEGFSWGAQIFTSASTGAKVDSRGDLKTDSLEFVQYAVRADGYYVKQLSDDPRNNDNYLRFYGAIGGRHFTNLTDSNSDEEAGAGSNVDVQVMGEYVRLVGDNQDVAGRVDVIFNTGSNATRSGFQVTLDTHPREGRGFGGSFSYSDTSTDVKEGVTVDGRIINAQLTYQLLKNGEFAPLPGGGHCTVYLGYDDQEYTAPTWVSEQRGPKLGLQVLVPLNKWKDAGNDEERNIAHFLFAEAYGQDAHVTATDNLGNTLVDDNVFQGHGFVGYRLEF